MKTKDELEKDLRLILQDSRYEKPAPYDTPLYQSEALMEKLVSYIVRRDALIFNHAVKVGKAMER